MKRIRRLAPPCTLLLLMASCSPAERAKTGGPGATASAADSLPLPKASPVDAGMSADRLGRIRPVMQRFVDDGELPGVMTMIARRGRIVHWEAVGMRDIEAGDPLEIDDIFRIFSMTKPITSTAIMMLVESGDIALEDPVSKYIPAFSDPTVLAEDGSRVEADRPLTIKHLLTHSGGLTYGFFEDTPVDRMYREQGLFETKSLEAFVTKAAAFPLRAQPGTEWIYSVSNDILGYIVEIASGQPFPDFLAERLLTPLGMENTAFWVPEEKRHRFVAYYRVSAEGLQRIEEDAEWSYRQEPPFASGGGGLVSTASDYLRFAQMLLGEGRIDGVRILEPETVRAMRQNQLSGDVELIPVGGRPPAYGFGFGFATLVDATATPERDHNGLFRWGGLANTFFWVDPEAELIAMVWTQADPFGVHDLRWVFQDLVYAALDD